MRLFRRKSEAEKIIKLLKSRPNEIFIGPEFIAAYLLDADKILIVHGDYRKLSADELNDLIVEKFFAFVSSQN